MRWFRMYETVLDDPKAQRLSDQQFRIWVNLLCVSSRFSGKIPADTEDLAFLLRIDASDVINALDNLIRVGLIDKIKYGYQPHNWNKRQYKSDVSTERVKQFRKRFSNANATVSETPPEADTEAEADTESETEKKKERVGVAIAPPRPKGTRWVSGCPVHQAWKDEARDLRARHSLPAIDLDLTAEQFVNFWTARAGPGSTKLDWKRTWLNWVLKERGTNGTGKSKSAHDKFLAGALAFAKSLDAGPSEIANDSGETCGTSDYLPSG